MLSEQQIKNALHAQRVIPLPKGNFHGPLGLEHLAAYVAEILKSPIAKVLGTNFQNLGETRIPGEVSLQLLFGAGIRFRCCGGNG